MPSTHVIPEGDLIEHEISDGCICGVVIEPVPCDDGSMGWLHGHSSLDGRESDSDQRTWAVFIEER